MKKCTCTVIYRYIENRYELINITVKHKHENILLYGYQDFRYRHVYFNKMYESVLEILKNNNFYVHNWKMFESTWYDIDFIDIDNPEINRYSYGGVTNVQR